MPGVAFQSMVIVIGRTVSLPVPAIVAVTPVPLATMAFTPPRLAPLIEPDTVVPWKPEFGLSDEMFGVLGLIVMPSAVVEPAGVVTVTVRRPIAAFANAEITMGRLLDVAPLEIAAVTPVPLTVTAVAPARFRPVIVAPTDVP